MANDSLLKDAIADAKAVKETAIENAKMAIEEAFTPRLHSILKTRLENDLDEDEDLKTDEGKTAVVDEAKKEEKDMDYDEKEDDDEDMDETKSAKTESDDMDDDEKEDDDEDDDDMDLESVIKELEDEISETIGTDQDPHDDDDANDKKNESEENKEVKESSDEEIDIEALIKEIESEDDDLATVEETIQTEQTVSSLQDVIKEKDSTIAEYRDTVITLKDKLSEINLLNAKLLYANKLFRAYEMNNEQKVKVIETMDRSVSPREVKLVYATLAQSFGAGGSPTKKASVKTVAEGASKVVATTKPDPEAEAKGVISEGIDTARLQKLANILT